MARDHASPHDAATPASVVCAWCKTTLSEGSLPASHGICARCLEERFHLPEGLIPFPLGAGASPDDRTDRDGTGG